MTDNTLIANHILKYVSDKMGKIVLLLFLVVLSIALIYFSKRFEQQKWFKRVDRIIGIPVILILLGWGVFEIVSGQASFFVINLKPLYNTTIEENPILYWFYVFAKFYFAFLFIIRVRQLYGKKN